MSDRWQELMPYHQNLFLTSLFQKTFRKKPGLRWPWIPAVYVCGWCGAGFRGKKAAEDHLYANAHASGGTR